MFNRISRIINHMKNKEAFGYKAFVIGEGGKPYCNLGSGNYYYETDKVNTHKGKVKLCESGFHYCDILEHCFEFYYPSEKNVVYYKVRASGTITEINGKVTKRATSDLELIKKLDVYDMIDILSTKGESLQALYDYIFYKDEYKNDDVVSYLKANLNDIAIMFLMNHVLFDYVRNSMYDRLTYDILIKWLTRYPSDFMKLITIYEMNILTDLQILYIAHIMRGINEEQSEILSHYVKDEYNKILLKTYIK